MKGSVLSHLDELRTRLIIIFSCISLMSIAGIAFSGWFLDILIDNITSNVDAVFISLTPFEFITTQVKLGVFIGIALSVPVILFHVARFISPALKRKERGYVYALVPVSILLFFLGFVFGYAVFLRVALVFLGDLGSSHGIQNMWGIGAFVSTVFVSCTIIGVLFNMPVAAFILSRIGVIRKGLLRGGRAYIYAGSFVVAALITPPDVITQVLLAVPMIILYEISMLLVRP